MGNEALAAARARAAGMDPFERAEACAVAYEGTADSGIFRIPFLGKEIALSFPDFEQVEPGPVVPPHIHALLVYYLAGSDGRCPSGEWISFAELPDGGFYVQAFRGYSAGAIVRHFADSQDELASAVTRVAARPIPGMADSAWEVTALPRVPIALLWWFGDDEFEPRADLLFDATASGHLTTDGLAVLGGWLAKTLTGEVA